MIVTATSASRVDLGVAARLFHGLSDPTRLAILLALLKGERRVTDLVAAVGSSQSNVSNHLACLRGCGIVVAEPEGRQTRYEVADPHLARALTALVDVTLAVDESVPCMDPDCGVEGCQAGEVRA